MAADRAVLREVRVGSTLLLPCRLTAKTAAGIALEAVNEAFAATGSFSIAAAAGNAVTGNWTTDPREQPVRVVAFALNVGDWVRSLDTGVHAIVAAVNVNGRPDLWSPSTAGRPSFPTSGWEVLGQVTLP